MRRPPHRRGPSSRPGAPDCASRLLRRNADGEALSALRPPRLEDCAACLRLHPFAEPVGSKALDPTRLERPLHDCGSSLSGFGRAALGPRRMACSGSGPLGWMGGSNRHFATAPRIRRLFLGKRGSLPVRISACQCAPDPAQGPFEPPGRPPDVGLPCYSRDRNRGFVVPPLSVCRPRGAGTNGGRFQKLRSDADMDRFCPSLCRSLLLLFDFNPPIRRAG